MARFALRKVRLANGRVVTRRVSLGALGDVDSATADRVSKAALLAHPATYAIAFLDRNGTVAKIDTFSTRTAMYNAWDAMVEGGTIPSNVQQITLLDKQREAEYPGEGWDMMVNPSVSTFSLTKINWKSAAPYILGAGLLIAGAVYLSRSGGKKKAPRARARRSTWRRRTLTVWR